MPNQPVKFTRVSSTTFNIITKEANTLYFLKDTHQIFLGDQEYVPNDIATKQYVDEHDVYTMNITMENPEDDIHFPQTDIDYLYANKPTQLQITVFYQGAELMNQTFVFAGITNITGGLDGHLVYERYDENMRHYNGNNVFSRLFIPKTSTDALVIEDVNYQEKLTFDNTPTENSTNPVTSGGVKEYVDAQSGGATVITLIPNESGSGFTSETTYKEAYDASNKTAVIFTIAQGENEIYSFLLSALKSGDNYTLNLNLGGALSLTGSADDLIGQGE